ncbi:hypothetical protein VN97_g13162, partial [Penicillium thymicola]
KGGQLWKYWGANTHEMPLYTPVYFGVLQTACARFSYFSAMSGFWIVGEISNE